MKKTIFSPIIAIALASAAFAASTYHVTLFNQSSIAGKTLKPGEYKLELKDDAIVLKQGKDEAQAPAKTETVTKKFKTTTVRYNGNREITEICIGGTNKKVVLNQNSASGTSGI